MAKRVAIEELRRNELIDATIATIAERGFLQTTVRDIAERAECSPASVLYYFPHKSDLLAVAFREADFRFREAIRAEILPLAGVEKLRRIVELCFPEDNEEPVWSVEMDVWALASREGHGDFREIFEAASTDWLDILMAAVGDAVGRGDLTGIGDVKAWAVKLAALIDGFGVHTRVTKHVDNSTARSMLLAEIEAMSREARDDKGERGNGNR
jgi:AcrR family transcriptional regulator